MSTVYINGPSLLIEWQSKNSYGLSVTYAQYVMQYTMHTSCLSCFVVTVTEVHVYYTLPFLSMGCIVLWCWYTKYIVNYLLYICIIYNYRLCLSLPIDGIFSFAWCMYVLPTSQQLLCYRDIVEVTYGTVHEHDVNQCSIACNI